MTRLHVDEKVASAINKRNLEDGFEDVRSTLGVLRTHRGGGGRGSTC